MSRARVLEHVPKASSVRSRHVFVIGDDGELESWSPGAPSAVPSTLVGMVRGILALCSPEDQRLFGEIVMQIDERFRLHIIRNASSGLASYAVIVEELVDGGEG